MDELERTKQEPDEHEAEECIFRTIFAKCKRTVEHFV